MLYKHWPSRGRSTGVKQEYQKIEIWTKKLEGWEKYWKWETSSQACLDDDPMSRLTINRVKDKDLTNINASFYTFKVFSLGQVKGGKLRCGSIRPVLLSKFYELSILSVCSDSLPILTIL